MVASVFTAELSAIILGLQIIYTFPVDYFTISSDSRSALSALNSYALSGNTLVLSALEWLYFLYKSGYRIEFCWVPGHVDVPGNKRADKLAREVAVRAALPSTVPCSDVLLTIREVITAICQERWNVCGATSKMSDINRTVSHPWNHTNVQDGHSQTS